MGNAIVIYRGKPKSNSWARWMCGRTMRKNQNNLISIVGRTGSGKTLSAISICEIMEEIDEVSFDVEKHVVFDLKGLMDLINSGELKKGSKIVCDEFQCSISAREFQSKANKIFNYVLSTFRHLNLTLFFCTPFESLLDKNTRKLFHARFETMSINKNKQVCRLKPRYIEYSDYKLMPYAKQMIVFFKDKQGKSVSRPLFHWEVPRPSKENEAIYERMKEEFTSRLNKNISMELSKEKSITDEQVINKEDRKPLTQRQEEVMKVLATIKGDNKLGVAGEILGVSGSAVGRNRMYALKKGFTVEEFEDNPDITSSNTSKPLARASN